MPDEESPQAQATGADQPGDNHARTIRKRARRACLACRARKVRCDVTRHGIPCMNCRLDFQECVVKPRAHKLQCPQRVAQQAQEGIRPPESVPTRLPSPDNGIVDPLEEFFVYSADDASVHELDEPSDNRLPEPCPTNTPQAEHGAYETISTQPPSCCDKMPSSNPWLGRVGEFIIFSCYPFIETDAMWRLSPQDATCLEQRGGFHLPSRPALDEFIVQYFRHVHPIIPLLNELEFWTTYLGPNPPLPGQKRIPLFLLQAMLFISCPYVPASTLHSLGFCSVRNARADFYSRAKALFDIDFHRDDVTSAQGALMLTYHAVSNDDKTNTYWLSTAVHFARNAHADHYVNMEANPKGNSRGVLKRLWWCCILRDRIMALGLRRPLNIRPGDFDFTQPGLSESDFQDEIRNSRVYNAATKQVLVQLAVSLCELVVVLNEPLAILYPMGPGTKINEPRDIERKINTCLADLNWWYEKTTAKFHIPSHIFGVHESLILFTDMMYIYYHTAKVSLCNHKVLVSVTDSDLVGYQGDRQLEAQAELDESLRSITEYLMELERLGQIKYLPNTFVAFSALPFVWYILDAKLINDGSESEGARKDLKIYIDVMKGFRSLYESTDSVLQSIGKVINYIKLNELLQLPSSESIIGRGAHAPAAAMAQNVATRSGSSLVHLLAGKPRSYLRIALVVEYSLSRGRLPSENDFPKPLRLFRRNNNLSSVYNVFEDPTDAIIYDCLNRALEADNGV